MTAWLRNRNQGEKELKYKNNIAKIAKGLEVSQICFSGGRVAASMANHGGLTQ